jgi:hypothetical protein
MAQVLICSLSLILTSGASEILFGFVADSRALRRVSEKQYHRNLLSFACVSREDLTRAAVARSQEGGA